MTFFKFVFAFLITWNLYGYESPRVQKGVIDLTRWKGETINLDGEWIFHWKRFLDQGGLGNRPPNDKRPKNSGEKK